MAGWTHELICMPSQSPLNWTERKDLVHKDRDEGKRKEQTRVSPSLGARMRGRRGLAAQSSDLIGQQDSKQVRTANLRQSSAMRGSGCPEQSMKWVWVWDGQAIAYMRNSWNPSPSFRLYSWAATPPHPTGCWSFFLGTQCSHVAQGTAHHAQMGLE